MSLIRRSLLQAMMGGLVALGGSAAAAVDAPAISLREAAARAGLCYGSDSDVQFANAPADYSSLFVKHCDLLAPLISWARSAPRQHDHEPAWEDPNISFARQHALRLTGAHLLWHENLPGWFGQLASQADAEQAIERHINFTTKRYAPLVYSWNVVNEAIEPKDGRPDGLRRSPLLDRLGPDYIATAFHMARAAAPDATLVYNEYGLEMDGPDQEARRTALLKLLDRLQAAAAPVDAIGLQSHLRLGGSRFDSRRYAAFLQEIANRKLAIIISELDVFDGASTSDAATRDAEVASLYSAFLDAALTQTAVVAVVTWGLADRYTWLNGRTDEHWARPGDRLARPLLFDTQLRAKPAFYAVLSAFNNASRRQPLQRKTAT